jgi:hypothetical protein
MVAIEVTGQLKKRPPCSGGASFFILAYLLPVLVIGIKTYTQI